MRIPLFITLVVALSVVLSACSGVKIKQRVAASAALQASATYRWKSAPLQGGESTSGDGIEFDQNLRTAVDNILVLKGFNQVDEGADFVMDYRIAVVPEGVTAEQYRNPSAINESGSMMGRIEFNNWGNTQAASEFYQRGYVVLTAFDSAKPKIWWESVANKMIDEGDSDNKKDKTLRKVVGKMMQTFPTAASK